jgi:hypothetical protein
MMNTKSLLIVLAALWGGLASVTGQAQVVYSEDFTGASTTNQWWFFSGACLTAGTGTATASPGPVPGCKTILTNYYSTAQDSDPVLVGGNAGYLGSSTATSGASGLVADPIGLGALRFTNGSGYGHQERGAILSADTLIAAMAAERVTTGRTASASF